MFHGIGNAMYERIRFYIQDTMVYDLVWEKWIRGTAYQGPGGTCGILPGNEGRRRDGDRQDEEVRESCLCWRRILDTTDGF